MEIKKEEFKKYKDVRESGVTNMCLINNVCDLTELERPQVLYIMKNYGELEKKFYGDD